MKKHILHWLISPTTELSPFLCDDNQLIICNGINPSYKKGQLIKDLGYSKVGDTLEIGKAITGLHHFRQTSSVQKILATINNATGTNLVLAYNNAGTWTDISLTNAWDTFENCKVEMEDFMTYCFFVGYDDAQNVFLPVGSLINTTFSVITNVADMPKAKYIKRYRDRLYIGNCQIGATTYPYRVYYSSVPETGSITWTVASDFIEVDYSEEITGLAENWDRLIIFTEFSAYLYNQSEKKKVWDIGCANNSTIKNSGAYIIWANKDNVWASSGGRPQAIGNNILELIKNSTPSDWRAEIIDEEYNFYLGSTIANGIDYANCLATLNIMTGMWRWRELNDNITSLTRYTTDGNDFLYLGCSDGEVMVKSKYTDTVEIYADDGNPISACARTKAYDFGDPSLSKKITKITAYSEYSQGVSLRYRVFDKNREILMPFETAGILKNTINVFEDLDLRGNFLQLELREFSKNQSFKFYGFTVEFILDKNK